MNITFVFGEADIFMILLNISATLRLNTKCATSRCCAIDTFYLFKTLLKHSNMLSSWIYMSFYRFKNNIYFFDRRGTDPSILHYVTTVCELLISAKFPQGWLGRGSW